MGVGVGVVLLLLLVLLVLSVVPPSVLVQARMTAMEKQMVSARVIFLITVLYLYKSKETK
jgi:fumarate reductase subunit D